METDALKSSWMRLAAEQAQRGGRAVMPNPVVGAVIVHDGVIIGSGYHERFGGPHAEVHAVQSVRNKELLPESTMYVTLEPCSHFGKTPPCADLVIESGIRHVVIGCRDPFEAVAGRGIAKLREAGVFVEEGVGERECYWGNRRFLTAHSEKRPYIILKWAETSDGFIARKDFSSKWISSEVSRNIVHQWRADEMAILVGSRTAQLDNPSLTVRHVVGRNPVRVVIDPNGRVPLESQLFDDAAETMLVSQRSGENQGIARECRLEPTQSVVPQVLNQLYSENIISVLVEGGSYTLQQFIDDGLWDEIRVFRSRVRFRSGIEAPSLEGLPPSTPHAAVPSGPDTLLVWVNTRLSRCAPTDWAVHAGIDRSE